MKKNYIEKLPDTVKSLKITRLPLSDEEEKRIEARFTWKDETLLFRLRSEYAQTIQNDIRHGVEAYGHSPRYWSYVRQLALKYWSQWNRDEIFEKAE